MKNKLAITFLVLMLTIVLPACQSSSSAIKENPNTIEKPKTEARITSIEEPMEIETTATVQPEPVVVEFYKLYLQALIANKQIPTETMKRYLTVKMLKEVKDTTDADVIIQAQDYDDTWANNVNIKGKEKLSDTKYIISVELKGKSFSQELKVTVVANGKSWKIDSIKETDAVESEIESAENDEVITTIVKFPRGTTGTEYQKTISPGKTQIYVINVRKGQYFGVQTYSDDYGVPFKVRSKDGDDLEVPPESVKWGGDAPESGDYEIIVSNVPKPTKYTISINAQ